MRLTGKTEIIRTVSVYDVQNVIKHYLLPDSDKNIELVALYEWNNGHRERVSGVVPKQLDKHGLKYFEESNKDPRNLYRMDAPTIDDIMNHLCFLGAADSVNYIIEVFW